MQKNSSLVSGCLLIRFSDNSLNSLLFGPICIPATMPDEPFSTNMKALTCLRIWL